jgi:hypothetical protein
MWLWLRRICLLVARQLYGWLRRIFRRLQRLQQLLRRYDNDLSADVCPARIGAHASSRADDAFAVNRRQGANARPITHRVRGTGDARHAGIIAPCGPDSDRNAGPHGRTALEQLAFSVSLAAAPKGSRHSSVASLFLPRLRASGNNYSHTLGFPDGCIRVARILPHAIASTIVAGVLLWPNCSLAG